MKISHNNYSHRYQELGVLGESLDEKSGADTVEAADSPWPLLFVTFA